MMYQNHDVSYDIHPRFDNTMRQHLVKAKRRRVTGAWKACNDATWKSDWRMGDMAGSG